MAPRGCGGYGYLTAEDARELGVPSLHVLHHEEIATVDQRSFDGIPVVSAAKAVRQAHEQHLRRSLLEQAIDDGLQGGWLRRRDRRSEQTATSVVPIPKLPYR